MTYLYICLLQAEDTSDNDITAVLSVDTCVWVGTRDGHLYVYNVTHKRCRHVGTVQWRRNEKCIANDVTQVDIECTIRLQRSDAVVRARDWQSSGHGFESLWFCLETFAISFTSLCQYLLEDTI